MLVWRDAHLFCTCVFFLFVNIHFSVIDLWILWIYNVLKVLFEKLCLHQRCENKKLPKTINKQQQSTSEAAVQHTQTHKHKQTHTNISISCSNLILCEKTSSVLFEVWVAALTHSYGLIQTDTHKYTMKHIHMLAHHRFVICIQNSVTKYCEYIWIKSYITCLQLILQMQFKLGISKGGKGQKNSAFASDKIFTDRIILDFCFMSQSTCLI